MLPLEARVLTEREIFAVLDDLQKRAKRSTESKQLLTVFRLATCCGLRPGEISRLQLRDVNVDQGPPKLEVCTTRIRGGKISRNSRVLCIDFDEGTKKDILAWRWWRYKQASGDRFAPLICGLRECNLGQPLDSRRLAKRWRCAIRGLGPERVRQLSISAGRHSCAMQLVRRGASPAAIQKFLGHASFEETLAYLRKLPGLSASPMFNVFSL